MLYVVDESRPHLGGSIEGGDSRTFCPDLWTWLIDRGRVRTVYDVGCAEGQAMDWFAANGCKVTGLDGLPGCQSRAGTFIEHDLSTGGYPLEGIDLVWCSEVVEHIEEQYLDHLLSTITCGRILAMNHAIPGQDGWHHVNCQNSQYWIDHIQARGMKFMFDHTMYARHISPGTFFGQTGLIFCR